MSIGTHRTVWIVALVAGVLGTNAAGTAAGQPIEWAPSVDQARQTAAASNKLVLLHFGASYCAPCRSLEQFVFSDPMVAQQINAQFVPVKIDIQAQPELAEKYAIARIPHDVILSADGQPVFRRLSPNSSANYRAMLQAGLQLAAATTPQAERVAEKISGMTQAEWEERVRSPFYGAEAARAGSLAGAPASLPAVPQHNGTLPRATLRESAAVAPGLFEEGSTGPANFPQHHMEQRQFPTVEHRSLQTLPAVQSPGVAGPATRSAEIFPLSTSGRGPSPGPGDDFNRITSAPPAGERLTGARSQVTENSFFQPSRPTEEKQSDPATVVNADYRSQAGWGTAEPASRVPTAVPTDKSPVQQVAANTPPVSAPLGLEGYCPVSLLTTQQWIKGEAAFGCQHRGVLYLFANEAAQAEFMASPDRLSPLLGGFDPVLLERERHFQPGKRRFGVFCEVQPGHSAIVLFQNEENREAFKQDSLRYLQMIDEITKKADLNSRP
jgi:thiol-disulfide isomerase/thioredoxin/YHS domain-containing protein